MPSSEQSERRFSLESEKPQHECGVFGIYAPGENVSRLTFHGISKLQHRGQESAGIATLSDDGIHTIRKMGLVREVFDEEDIRSLPGYAAIGHTRYSNTGSSNIANAQPAIYGQLAVSENGNLTNSDILRKELDDKAIFASTIPDGTKCSSDGEIIVQTIALAPGESTLEKVYKGCQKLEGAYTLTILSKEGLLAVRDPRGFWPLCLGTLNGNGYVVASETISLEFIGADYIRDVNPGEILSITAGGLKSLSLPTNGHTAECPFDWNYFRRPDSKINPDLYVYQFRMMLGQQLAIERPVQGDVVIAEKDSGTFAAHGFARQSGIPFSEGSIKDPYTKRIFIDPTEEMRDSYVDFKHSILEPEIRDRRVVVVTDSIVRGTQCQGFTRQLRYKGAREVHYRTTFPKITDPCYFGIDTYEKKELIGSDKNEDEIAKIIGADSVGYMSPHGLESVISQVTKGRKLDGFCQACFTGKYPIPLITGDRDKHLLGR